MAVAVSRITEPFALFLDGRRVHFASFYITEHPGLPEYRDAAGYYHPAEPAYKSLHFDLAKPESEGSTSMKVSLSIDGSTLKFQSQKDEDGLTALAALASCLKDSRSQIQTNNILNLFMTLAGEGGKVACGSVSMEFKAAT